MSLELIVFRNQNFNTNEIFRYKFPLDNKVRKKIGNHKIIVTSLPQLPKAIRIYMDHLKLQENMLQNGPQMI